MVKKYIVRLTGEERGRLTAMVTKGRTNAQKIRRAQVLLKVDAAGPNWTDEQTAEAFGMRANTVADIRAAIRRRRAGSGTGAERAG